MSERPQVVAFDVIETLFPLEPLRDRLDAAGLPGASLETWFAQTLRDGFAMDTAGVFRPFREIAADVLSRQFAQRGIQVEAEGINGILAGFAALEPHPDVAPAMLALQKAGVRAMAVTNGGAGVTDTLLERAGLRDLVERIVSIDEVGHWKPRRDVYLHCASAAGVPRDRLALVAAHGWDIQGARRAGLLTGYVDRGGKPYPEIMEPPDVTGADLVETVQGLTGSAGG